MINWEQVIKRLYVTPASRSEADKLELLEGIETWRVVKYPLARGQDLEWSGNQVLVWQMFPSLVDTDTTITMWRVVTLRGPTLHCQPNVV